MSLTICTSFASTVFFLSRQFKLNVIGVRMKRASLFPVRKMDALPKTLSRGSSEGKYEWWTEGLEQKSPASDLITMCLWRDSDRDQRKSLVLRNILFTVQLCHFFQLGHIQRWVADDTSKHNDSALNLQSAEKKRFSHLQRSLLMNHQRRGTRRGSREGRRGGPLMRTRADSAAQVAVRQHTAVSVCMLTSSFSDKNSNRDEGIDEGSLYVLCRHSVVWHQNKEFCSSAISSSLSLTYSMSKLKTDDKNGPVDL